MPGPWELALILLVVILVFGTKKLRGMGKDVGAAVHDFKSALDGEEKPKEQIHEKESAAQSQQDQK
ncbi:MAG: twin-arginine translocase TatA/TatE family subunit [Candidatus Eutrophobiaceae bacterium]